MSMMMLMMMTTMPIYLLISSLYYNHIYSNSAFILLTKCSTETGFLIKHPILIAGYISLKASWFTSAADIKQILGLGSISNIFVDNSKPFITGILMSISNRL